MATVPQRAECWVSHQVCQMVWRWLPEDSLQGGLQVLSLVGAHLMLAPQSIGMKVLFHMCLLNPYNCPVRLFYYLHVPVEGSVADGAQRQRQSLQADEEGTEPLRTMTLLLHVGGAVDAGGVASALGKTGPEPGAITVALSYLTYPVGQVWSGSASLRELGLARGAQRSVAWAPPHSALGHCTLLSTQKAPRPRCVFICSRSSPGWKSRPASRQ